MALTQLHYVVRKKSESGQSGTVTYDLPRSGVIPTLTVRAFSTPTASSNPALPLNKAITSIKVMDGGNTLVDLSPNQLLGVHTHRFGRNWVSTEINDNGAEGYEDFPIHLGAMLNGVLYAPDFSKFSNPQIEITWDYSQTSDKFGVSYDADTSPAMKFTVVAHVLRNTAKYQHGYVKSKVIRTLTSAASATVTTDIPRGLPLVGLMIEAGYLNLSFTEDVNQLKLDFNTGEWTPLDLYEEEIVPFNRDVFGTAEVSFIADLIDNKAVDLHMNFPTKINFLELTDDSVAFNFQKTHIGIATVGKFATETPAAITSYSATMINAVGLLPFNCFYVPSSYLTGGDSDLLDTSKWRNIDLTIVQSANVSTSSTPSIIAEYLVR